MTEFLQMPIGSEQSYFFFGDVGCSGIRKTRQSSTCVLLTKPAAIPFRITRGPSYLAQL